MADVTVDQLRAEVRKLLVGIDLKTFTIGKLRASVETALGLNQGDLAERKSELTELVQAELANQETPTPAAKKQKVEVPKPGAQGKEKKDKKVKKEKKDKVEKVEKKSGKLSRQAKSKDKDKKQKKEKHEATAEAEAMGEAEVEEDMETGDAPDAPDAAPANAEEEGLVFTGLALAEPLVSCEADAADWEECLPEEDTLLLQVGVRVSQQTLRRSVLESGVKFGPKTSAALFLLLSCTFGFACLCGNAKPFITAPYSGFPEEEESEEVRQQSLLACYFVVFMDAFGFGVYAPFVPVLAKTSSLQAHDIGMALAAFSLAQALNTPILGYLSDRFGRRPVLLVALAAESLAYLILSVAESFTCLMVGYIFAGAFCATIGVCNAYIAQVSAEEDRPVRFAYSSGSIALGLMTGPVLGAALSQQGFAAAVRICAALSMLNWTFVFSYMAESPNVLLRRQPIDVGCVPDSLPRLAWPLLIGAFLGNAGIAAAESCGALFVMDSYFKFTKSPAVEGTKFFAWNRFISGGVVILITNFVFPSLMHRLRQKGTMVLGIGLRIFGYTGLAAAPTKWWFLAAQLVVVTGDCLAAPNLSALLTEVVGQSAYGMALGTLSTFQAAARVLDTVPFATMYEKVSHAAPFLTVALLAVASGALWFWVYWQVQAARA